MVERYSDEILAKMAKDGDAAAFEELFDRYKRPIVNFIYRLIGNKETAEEVAQEAFMRAYKSLRIYDPGRKFSTWLYTIARNLAKNALRDRKYFRDISLEEKVFGEDENIRLKDVLTAPGADPGEIAQDEELALEAQKVIESLPMKYREVITLCSIQQLTYKEAAAIIGCSESMICVMLNDAKALFMKRLGIGRDAGEGSE